MLFEPEIPQNTGNIIRLGANTGATLHLIEPLGFQLEDKRMRRAGLDYHEYADLSLYDSWRHFKGESANHRLFGLSTKGSKPYSSIDFQPTDFVIFGPETRGLPKAVRNEIGQENIFRIPMLPDSRSLNLSNAVAVIIYYAWQQHQFPRGN